MKLVIQKDRCPQNHKCPAVDACPVDALVQQGHEAPTVNEEACISCGKCAKVCRTGALELDDASA